MYQIFEIKLKPKEIDLRCKLDEVNRLNWHLNCGRLVKSDDGLKYVLDGLKANRNNKKRNQIHNIKFHTKLIFKPQKGAEPSTR